MNEQLANTYRDSPNQLSQGGRHHVEFVMGMAVSIDIRHDVPSDAIDDVVRWLHHVDATFSTYKSDSPISRLGTGMASLEDRSTLAAREQTSAPPSGTPTDL